MSGMISSIFTKIMSNWNVYCLMAVVTLGVSVFVKWVISRSQVISRFEVYDCDFVRLKYHSGDYYESELSINGKTYEVVLRFDRILRRLDLDEIIFVEKFLETFVSIESNLSNIVTQVFVGCLDDSGKEMPDVIPDNFVDTFEDPMIAIDVPIGTFELNYYGGRLCEYQSVRFYFDKSLKVIGCEFDG